MKAKDLLSQLSRLEHALSGFSYEELTSAEAARLKASFKEFQKNLETKIAQPSSKSFKPTTFITSDSFQSKSNTDESTSRSNDIRLVGQVSHEIRTPLNGIIGFTDLLLEDNSLNDKQLSQVNAIKKASYSLMEIISELLEYSKLSSGLETFESVSFNFRNLIGDITYLCQILISDKAVKFNLDIDKQIPDLIIGDPSKLSQILLNLIGNAIKFVESGHIELSINRLRGSEKGVYLQFIISDTGIGISKENLNHIFDAFKQAESNTFKKYGGSGLGLSIVKQLIEKLGGEIKVTSEVGVGSTFTFSLPYDTGTSDSFNGRKTEILASDDDYQTVANTHILVFEDNTLNQKLIHERLKSWGCHSHITADAQVGLELLENKKIDAILMDLKMPIMNGFEISKLIRAHANAEIKNIPIIALSADFSSQDKSNCKEYGINDFILKPFRAADLLIQLAKNIRGREGNLAIIASNTHLKPAIPLEQKVCLSPILEDCMGQLDLLEELIMLFKQNNLEFIGSVKGHMKTGNLEQIAFAAHKIKSGLKMLQATKLLSIIEQMQTACQINQGIQNLEILFESYLNEYPLVEEAIDQALDSLRKK